MQKLRLTATAAVTFLSTFLTSAAQTDPAPGTTVEFPWEGAPKTPLLHLPENYDRTQTWPVIFHYHGTGGSPTVDIPLAYTGGRDFVIVGMPYITQGQKRPERDYLLQEMDFLKAIRKRLATQFRIDPKRSYVGGFSKGGWFASEYAESFMREFAGAYILGAGWNHTPKRPTQAITDKKPVYIGIGQFDDNHSHSVAAIRRFKELGATVLFDEYLTLGHSLPMERAGLSEYFTQWFQIEAARPAIAKLKDPVRLWAEKKTDQLGKLSSVLDRYLFIERLKGAPFHRYLNKTQRAPFEKALADTIGTPGIKAELRVKKAYLDALSIVSKARGMEDKRAALDHCWALYEKHPETHFGKRTAVEILRLRSHILALDRWHWPSLEARQAFEKALKTSPLPQIEDEVNIRNSFQQILQLLR